MNSNRYEKTRDLMRQQISEKLFAGEVVADADTGPIIVEGKQCFIEKQLPMTEESLFDIASVGKTFTASMAALFVADGRLDPDAPFTEYLPEHVLAKGKCDITIRDLATHSSGFDNSKPYWNEPDHERFLQKLYSKLPVRARGECFDYACSNFIYLGKIIEKLSGEDLDATARRLLWGPLGMTHTTWYPVKDDGHVVEFPPSSYAGTGPRKIGDHNDLACHQSPLPLGSGSVFTTAGDLRLFLSDLLHRRLFPKAFYDLLFAESFSKGGIRRSFGWDMPAINSSSELTPDLGFSDASIAHSGWTGPAIIVDPEKGFAGVFLGSATGEYIASKQGRMKVLATLAENL